MASKSASWNEIELQKSVVTVCACFILLVVIFKLYRYIGKGNNNIRENLDATALSGPCKFPNCVRCRRNKEVLLRARTRLSYYDESQEESNASSLVLLLKDVQSSYHRLNLENKEECHKPVSGIERMVTDLTSQNPLVFHMKGILAKPVWNCDNFPGLGVLAQQVETIQTELGDLLKLYHSADTASEHWKVNETPSGQWCVCHLLDQGAPTKALKVCPKTWQIIGSIPHLMMDNIFSNVAFSVLKPGTTVPPHFGPTNIRIRCHLGLSVPKGWQLTVGDASLHWTSGEVIAFDETYLHSVQHVAADDRSGDGMKATNTSTGDRVVLMMDLWHPDISPEQRTLINYAFSPVEVMEF